MARACLVDVYDTILKSDYIPRAGVLTSFLDVDIDTWEPMWLKTADERGRGTLSMADSFERTLRDCGIAPTPGLVSELVRMDAELLVAGTQVYDDTAAFFAALRSAGIATALVSNCSQNTRQMLEKLDLIPLADSVILSCEAGSLKPAPEIYLRALADLRVTPADAVMVDDQAKFCVGAHAPGMRAIQITRPGLIKPVPDSAFPVVTSLLDVLPLL